MVVAREIISLSVPNTTIQAIDDGLVTITDHFLVVRLINSIARLPLVMPRHSTLSP